MVDVFSVGNSYRMGSFLRFGYWIFKMGIVTIPILKIHYPIVAIFPDQSCVAVFAYLPCLMQKIIQFGCILDVREGGGGKAGLNHPRKCRIPVFVKYLKEVK